MTELVATTPGLFPLPDWAKTEVADRAGSGGGRHPGDGRGAVAEAYGRARREVLDDQVEAGLDRIVEGQLRWTDMLAHPLVASDATERGDVRRYYENNNFYRAPRVVAEPTPTGAVAEELRAARDHVGDAPLQAVLPGPYSLSDLAIDDRYGDPAEFLAAVAEFLAGEVERFPEVETLFLLEPSLVVNPPGDDLDARVPEAVDVVADATDADVVVYAYWGALEEKVYAHLMDATVEALGFDFVTEQDRTLYNVTEYGTTDAIAAGVVDGQNTRVEDPETVRERVDWIDERVPAQEFDRVYVTASTELFYLPTTIAREKLGVLAAATGEVEA